MEEQQIETKVDWPLAIVIILTGVLLGIGIEFIRHYYF